MERWPEHLMPESMDWHLQANSKAFTSAFNQSTNTVGFPGEHWLGTMNFPSLNREKACQIEVFIRRLGGANGRFLLRDMKSRGRPAKGQPVVAQPDQAGGLLMTTGWQANQLVLLAGDYFGVGNELKQCDQDILADANGTALLSFYPWLRTAPAVNTPIVTDCPVGVFRLKDDSQGKLSHRILKSNTTIEFVEAFYV